MQIVIITFGKATIQIQPVLHGIDMAFTNLIEVPKKTLFTELACSTEFNRGVHNHLIVILALNGFVAITAFSRELRHGPKIVLSNSVGSSISKHF